MDGTLRNVLSSSPPPGSPVRMAMIIDPPFYPYASAATIRALRGELEDFERDHDHHLDTDDIGLIAEVRGEAEYFLRTREEQDPGGHGRVTLCRLPAALSILVDRDLAHDLVLEGRSYVDQRAAASQL